MPGKAATQLVTGWQASRPHLLAALRGRPGRHPHRRPRRAARPHPRRHHQHRDRRVPAAERGQQDGRPAARRPAEPRRPPAGRAAGSAAAPADDRRGPRLPGPGAPRHAADRRRSRHPAGRASRCSTDALRAVGRRPGDYSNKVDADITAGHARRRGGGGHPAAPARHRSRRTWTACSRTSTRSSCTTCGSACGGPASALKLFGDALERSAPRSSAFFAAEFKWVGDLTTPTRDLDVHLLDFEETARGLAAAKPDDLEPFRAYLEQRRRKEFRALVRGLRSARFTGAHQRLARAADQHSARQREAGRRQPGLVPGRPTEPRGRPPACSPPSAPGWPSPRSPGAARRSPPTRPPRPCTTCASGARSCGTRWSSSPPCTTPPGTRRWWGTSSGSRTVWENSRTQKCKSARSGRSPRPCSRRARRRR